ncbi:hypothetical protein HGA64_03575 [Candidatus Falkowbacteria bacterium]|nr:hypothetical protein [Candidatus Falkowbacteria bacterium]
MDFSLDKNKISLSGDGILRRAGYGFIHDNRTGKDSYVRRLTRDFYPRLHMYLKEDQERIFFSLHLDQKHASYQGNNMHNAEYDGPIVAGEVERLKQVVIGLMSQPAPAPKPEQEKKSSWYQFWK